MEKEPEGEGAPDFGQTQRFDYLMARYLAREASEQEKEELRWLTKNGFGAQFQIWIDAQYKMEASTEPMPDQVQAEILANILGAAPAKQKAFRFRWSWAAAAILILGSVWWLTFRNVTRRATIADTEIHSENPDRLDFKGKQYLNLPDGSSVLMNEGSELSYSPRQFAKGIRTVTLQGEAYFDVAHDPKSVFQVRAGAVVTRVLGTAFNVRVLPTEVKVTVTRGLVEVGGNDRIYTKVKPDEQVTVNVGSEKFTTTRIDADRELAWRNNFLVFDNITLEEARELIENHYGTELTFTEPEILRCRITASFLNAEDLPTVLKVLSAMTGATYSVDGKKATITGGSCT
ncbi:FecR family protein [Dyadobacter crusticola]|uniref:FecR family protein n=1 Tax=Dyadobacter crusticola TaxID=292407 RepID=UPI0004E1129E|nr:FecR domain-containing protein [Dyadobacter crusticola]